MVSGVSKCADLPGIFTLAFLAQAEGVVTSGIYIREDDSDKDFYVMFSIFVSRTGYLAIFLL